MVTALIIVGILIVFVVGFYQVYNLHSRVEKKLAFANEYRNKFILLTNKYFETYDRWSRSGNFDSELYVWLTMNVSQMQEFLGNQGVMEYIAPFQTYKISNYQIVINTIPKFRDGSIEDFDINSVDDCLLRYIGYLEGILNENINNLKNPIIWFREGFREVLSIPIFILYWFGIISSRTVSSIKDSLIFKAIAGLISLITLISSIVTIIVGKDQTLEFIHRLLGK